MRTVYGYKGINATNVNFDNLNSILIGLHLFFTDYSDEYKENVEERIKNHKGPVIIMDDEVGLDYIDLKKNEMYFVKTHLCSPEPKIGERFYKFLNEFHSREVELMGGYKNGCLKGLEDELRDRNYMTSLVEGCVFAKQ